MEYCPQCGEELEHNGPFCGSCGSKVGDTTEAGRESSGATGSDDPRSGEHSATAGDRKVVPKREAGIVGITIGLLSSLGIMAGSLFPLSESCTRYNFGESVSCSTVGGLLNDPIIAIILFTSGFVLFLLVVDDYKEIGFLGSWEPRKTRVYGGYGGFIMLCLLIAFVSYNQPRSGAVILFVSAATLLGFSGVVGFWRIAFRKKAGAK